MMEALIIKNTEFTPGISFRPDSRTFEFSGVSRPENVIIFYTPAINWMLAYEFEMLSNQKDGNTSKALNIIFNLTYFNSSSEKKIFNILESFSRIQKMGYPIQIDWYYEKDDDQMYEDGMELSEAVNIPFNFYTKD
jgi:hypothetical protein